MKIKYLETSELLLPEELISRLIKASGMKRNELHVRMQKLIPYRSIGSPTRLSDFGSDKSTRNLPLRDLVPLFDAIPMKVSHRDYYISELFKAYTDRNFERYISAPRKSTVACKLDEIHIEVTKAQYVKVEEQLLITQYQLAEISIELDDARKELSHYKAEAFGLRHRLKRVDPEDKSDKLDHLQDEMYLDEIESDAIYGEEYEPIDPFEEAIALEEKNIEAALHRLSKDLFLWREAAKECFKSIDNSILNTTLEAVFNIEASGQVESMWLKAHKSIWSNSHQSWQWVKYRVRRRPLNKVLASLFLLWLEKDPNRWEAIAECLRYSKGSVREQAIEILEKTKEGGRFDEFIEHRIMYMRKECPALWELLYSQKGYQVFNFQRWSLNTFREYADYIDSGWMEFIPFDSDGINIRPPNQDLSLLRSVANMVILNETQHGINCDSNQLIMDVWHANNREGEPLFVLHLERLTDFYNKFHPSPKKGEAVNYFCKHAKQHNDYGLQMLAYQELAYQLMENGLNVITREKIATAHEIKNLTF